MSASSDPDLRAASRVWARIGLLSFGGPAGQIALMHRELVEERHWIDEDRFLHALNFCMMLPGPEAMQLATYVGWLKHGWRGGLIAGGFFVLPGVIAIMGLSWIYLLWGQGGWISAVFFGLKAAVVAIVAQALLRIAKKALRDGWAWAIALAAFVAIFALGVPFPAIVLAAALLGYLRGRGGPRVSVSFGPRPAVLGTLALWLAIWLGPVVALVGMLGADHIYAQVALYFSQMAVLTFGGAYAVLGWVAQAAVNDYGWLSAAQMLDGLAMAETTPGPLIMVTQFVGFMAGAGAGGLWVATLAGLITVWVTFAPCFLWIFVGAPFAEALRGHPALASALAAVTAAVVGVIANLALWFAVHTLFAQSRIVAGVELPVWASLNPSAAILAGLALIAGFATRIGTGGLILGAGAAGVALHLSGLA